MSASMDERPVPGAIAAAAAIDVRRVLDVLAAVLLLVLLAPLMLAVVLAIWAEDGGPVFFSQSRLGHRGRPFRLHKFRKFKAAGEQTGPHLTLKRDRRMTRVGSVLERTKLDELPQVWNILIGDMALVGPRPESLAFADCFQGAYDGLLAFRPGIFGPCQAIFRNENAYYTAGCDPEELYRSTIFPLKASIDLGYYPRRTLRSDFGWSGRSALAVLGWPLLPHKASRDLEELNVWLQNVGRFATESDTVVRASA